MTNARAIRPTWCRARWMKANSARAGGAAMDCPSLAHDLFTGLPLAEISPFRRCQGRPVPWSPRSVLDQRPTLRNDALVADGPVVEEVLKNLVHFGGIPCLGRQGRSPNASGHASVRHSPPRMILGGSRTSPAYPASWPESSASTTAWRSASSPQPLLARSRASAKRSPRHRICGGRRRTAAFPCAQQRACSRRHNHYYMARYGNAPAV
jgi:hypothetical protein